MISRGRPLHFPDNTAEQLQGILCFGECGPHFSYTLHVSYALVTCKHPSNVRTYFMDVELQFHDTDRGESCFNQNKSKNVFEMWFKFKKVWFRSINSTLGFLHCTPLNVALSHAHSIQPSRYHRDVTRRENVAMIT